MLATTGRYARLDNISREIHERRGILNSEMAAVIAMSLAERVDVFVESGRARGHSTLLLAKHLGSVGIEIHSFDRSRDADAAYSEEKLAGYANLHLHYGDSRLLIPEFVAGVGAKRVGLLIDGPKDKKALDLLSDCLIRSPSIVVAFVHDLPQKNGVASEGRACAVRYFEDPFFTDDAAYVLQFGPLDASAFAEKKNAVQIGTSYGPTLGVFIPTDRDRENARQRGRSSSALKQMYWALKDRLRTLGLTGTR